MAVLKEWCCLEHGEFEGSHPICPFQPCSSEAVVQEFRTPPKIGTGMVRRHEKGLRRTADIYALSDLRTAREGEISKPAYTSEFGTELAWGHKVQEKMGASFSMLAEQANRPLGDQRLNNGMAAAATEAGITSVTPSARPPSFETTYEKGDEKSAGKAAGLLPTGMVGHTARGRGLL
jgi:hypothetical protein